MKTRIGAVIFVLGLLTAESEWLIVPIALVALGAWLMRGVIGDDESAENQ